MNNIFSEESNKKTIELIKESFDVLQKATCPIVPDDKLFYHYTNHQGMLGIINSSSFWATDSFYLNDSSEGSFGKVVLEDAINKEINIQFKLKEEIDYARELIDIQYDIIKNNRIRTYIVSFCENGDLLSQWRGYAGGSGVSLGLSKQFFTTATDKVGYPESPVRWEFYKVFYGEDAKLVAQNLAGIIIKEIKFLLSITGTDITKTNNWEIFPSLNTLINIYDRFIASSKHGGFAEECEWRLVGVEKSIPDIKLRTSESDIIPYVEFNFPSDFYKTERHQYNAFEGNDDDTSVNDERDSSCELVYKRKCDKANYLKEIIIGPTAHFERRERAIEELLKTL